jgi:PleD family two-component response regulator
MAPATVVRPRQSIPEVVDLGGSEPDEFLRQLPAPVRELHKNRRILIVDDFREGAEVLAGKLRRIYKTGDGCVVDVISDSTQAVDAIADGNYDVVVLDLFMKVGGRRSRRIERGRSPQGRS